MLSDTITPEPAHPEAVRLSCRGLVVDQNDRVLLVAHAVDAGTVWVGPGGGVEPGESLHAALARELFEEIGLRLKPSDEAPLVWVRENAFPDLLRAGYSLLREHYFLVRTDSFDPSPGVPAGDAGHPDVEGILDARWWSVAQIAGADDTVLFAPRDLGRLLGPLLEAEREGRLPDTPLPLGR